MDHQYDEQMEWELFLASALHNDLC